MSSTTARRLVSGLRSATPSGSRRSSRRTATPMRMALATTGLRSRPIGRIPRRPIARRSARSSRRKPRAGSTRTHGVPDPTTVSPDGQNLDNFYLARPGSDDVQLDLFGDYKSNVALYHAFQDYFRKHTPPFLAVWGKNDPFFIPPGAEAFKRDNPNAVVQFFDTGHFALETHAQEIADSIRAFLTKRKQRPGPLSGGTPADVGHLERQD